MFSMIFGSGKKKSSSDENVGIPPIPGARSDDDYVMIGNKSGPTNIYPSIPSGVLPPQPVSMRPAPQPPFHYLQGVPFRLCKELQMNESKNSFTLQIGDVLASAARKIRIEDYDYDFSLERSVVRE